jgi:shikimate kinase
VEYSRAIGRSRAAITVVSAFASGKGVAIGIDLSCQVTAELRPKREGSPMVSVYGGDSDPHSLVKICAENSLAFLRNPLSPGQGLVLRVESTIPPAVGLKSSSAVSVATTRAIFSLFGQGDSDLTTAHKILRLSCQASIQSGASLTGAFDDAAAGLLGGLVFSDNLRFRLLKHETLDPKWGTNVRILLLPKRRKLTSSLVLSMYHEYKDRAIEAIGYATKGIMVQAMFLNSIIHSVIHSYSLEPVVSSIEEGASTSGITGKGPAVAAISRTRKTAERIEERWLGDYPGSKVISADISQRIRWKK